MVAEEIEILDRKAEKAHAWANFAAGTLGGVSGLMVGVALVNALLFGIYGGLLNAQLKSPNDRPSLSQIFIAGTGSGVVNSIISCPMELAKIRLQNQTAGAQKLYKGPLDCFLQTYRRFGVRGCYRGMWVTVLRETSYGPYFLSYELLSRALAPPGVAPEDLGGTRLVVAGGMAGICGWMSTYPADVLKTKIQNEPSPLTPSSHQHQNQNQDQHRHRYRGTGIVDSFRSTIRTEGFPGLFRGSVATIVRAFPCNAATFLVYTFAMRSFLSSNDDTDEI